MNHRVQMDSPIGVLTIESNEDAITHIALPGEGPQPAPPSDGRRPSAKAFDGRPASATAGDGRVPATKGRRPSANAAPGRSQLPASLPAPLVAAVAQLEEYFSGRRRSFDVPLELDGTDFQRQVWLSLPEIPYGETVSYAELAMMVGRPQAYRAVGQANGANRVPIILPCHRVIASGGGLGGYGGGLPMKRQLLALEGLDFS